MIYVVSLTEQALTDSDRLELDEPKVYQKFLTFLKELAEHPKTGTGHPEPLKVCRKGDGADDYRRSIPWSIASSTPRWWCLFSQHTVITTTSSARITLISTALTVAKYTLLLYLTE